MTKTLIKNSRGTAALSASRAPRRNALKLAVSAGLVGWSLMAAQSAHAFGFDLFDGKVSGRFDTTLSYGLSLRTNDPDPDLIGKAFFDPLIGTRSNAEQRAAPGRFSVNSDDGNLNFGDKWDVVSNNVKALSELELSYENYGFFGRASYFRDFAYAGKDRFTRTAKSLVGDRFQLLDA